MLAVIFDSLQTNLILFQPIYRRVDQRAAWLVSPACSSQQVFLV